MAVLEQIYRDASRILPPEGEATRPLEEAVWLPPSGGRMRRPLKPWARRATLTRHSAGDNMAKLHVRILHDNLTHAHYPVLVSHYRHDVIVAAEKYLDDQLDGRLSELLRMELYAGPINTGVVVLNE